MGVTSELLQKKMNEGHTTTTNVFIVFISKQSVYMTESLQIFSWGELNINIYPIKSNEHKQIVTGQLKSSTRYDYSICAS